MIRTRTYSQKPSEVTRAWYVVDAANIPLGRLATAVAGRLSGKLKPTYTPHIDGGDYVVVINGALVKLSGRKEEQKIYWRHSGYPGGIKSRTAAEVRARQPEFIVEHAVKGMLPKNKLAPGMLARLRVFAGAEHDHEAQQPQKLEVF
jgi:large subunit ribosomal protein L13